MPARLGIHRAQTAWDGMLARRATSLGWLLSRRVFICCQLLNAWPVNGSHGSTLFWAHCAKEPLKKSSVPFIMTR